MASSITWLDVSAEEQRRMQQAIGLFTDHDAREELGLGQIRDAVGDALFPGSSTLHTRARYLLFIPWIYELVSRNGGTLGDARRREVNLINALTAADPGALGIIGSSAKNGLKTVPSVVYWSALGTYGILEDPGLSREQALAIHGIPVHEGLDFADQPGRRTGRAWRAGIPAPPTGFPEVVAGGMSLTREEGAWLQERLIDSTEGTLLAYLATHGIDQTSDAPWLDPYALSATGTVGETLCHARYFSNAIHGAQLLYNLLIAESYDALGIGRIDSRTDHYRREFEAWAADDAADAVNANWDVNEFFVLVTRARGGRRVAHDAYDFVRRWISLLRDNDPSALASDPKARDLVARREQRKGPMARIGNPKRLAGWNGSSGAGKYFYRWSYVQRILGDIFDGLGVDGA